MDHLSAEEILALGLELPEELSIRDIVNLWIDDPSKRQNTEIMLINENHKGILKGTQVSSFYYDVMIKPNDFLTYLEYKGIPEPTGCKLVKWLKRSESQAEGIGNAGTSSHWWLNTNQSLNDETDQTKETKNAIKGFQNPESQTHKTRKRRDNLTRAIMAAMQSLKRKPSFDELWQYFQDDKDETGFIEDYTDEAITWRDTKGKLHDTTRKKARDRLSSLKYPE